MTISPDFQALYTAHFNEITARTERSLAACGFETLWIHSGLERPAFLDDQTYPFRPNPHFTWWVPHTEAPRCLLFFSPGRRPVLFFHCPRDFWHLPPVVPDDGWTQLFDIRPVGNWAETLAALPTPDARTVIVGEPFPALEALTPATLNPPTLLRWLHEQRVRKTPYELACQREATRLGVAAHRAARAAHAAGESEYGIHQAFLAGCGQRELELPYRAIVARGSHGATLHYQALDRHRPATPTSLLIDAGATFRGYGSDITRTWPAVEDGEFADLVAALDRVQQALCARVRPGIHWPDLHLQAHHDIASLLRQAGILRVSPEAAVETGLSSVFLPHGLGHLLGLQVHDVGGFHPTPDGPASPPPPGHPALRLTRTLDPGMVVTMEPGIYFIDVLLEQARQGHHADGINWNAVNLLRIHGGIRIEDNLVVKADGCENLTRESFAATAA